MSSKKMSAEEELEKQYSEYKAQYMQWKERNRDSEGTEAYIRYVKQFEDWEREVERRRASVRRKAERERQAAAEKEMAAKREREAQRRRDEEAAAQAYAEGQSQYLAMHQKALQEEQRGQHSIMGGGGSGSLSIQLHSRSSPRSLAAAVATTHSPHAPFATAGMRHPAAATIGAMGVPQPSSTAAGFQLPAGAGSSSLTAGVSAPPGSGANPMLNMMQQMMSFVMKAEKRNGDAGDKHQHQQLQYPSAVPPPSTYVASEHSGGTATAAATSAAPPPQLWGNEGASYPPTDPMFRRWNVRAAPPNFRIPYQPPPPGTPIAPGWLTQKRMKEEQLVYVPKAAGAIPAGGVGGGPQPIGGIGGQQPVAGTLPTATHLPPPLVPSMGNGATQLPPPVVGSSGGHHHRLPPHLSTSFVMAMSFGNAPPPPPAQLRY